MNVAAHAEYRKRFGAGLPVIKDALPFERKASSVDEGARTAIFVISDGSVDRDGDVIDPDGWDFSNYVKNPVVLYGHDNHKIPVGQCVGSPYQEIGPNGAKVIKAKVKFDDHSEIANEVFGCVVSGSLRATSVGFRELEGTDATDRPNRWGWPGRNIKRSELLEFSIVDIPANPNALLAEKGMGGIPRPEDHPMAGTKTPASTDPTAPTTGEGLQALHKEMLKTCEEMATHAKAFGGHVKDLAKCKDDFGEYHKMHKDAVAVHQGLVEDHKAVHKAHKESVSAMGDHVSKLESAVKALKDTMGVSNAIDATQAAYSGALHTKLAELEAKLNDPKSTTDERLAAATEIKATKKLIAKAGKVLSAANRDAVIKAMEKLDHAKEHLGGVIKAADEADADDDDDDDDDDGDGAGDDKAITADAARTKFAELKAKADAGDADAKKQIAEITKLIQEQTVAGLKKAQGKVNWSATGA